MIKRAKQARFFCLFISMGDQMKPGDVKAFKGKKAIVGAFGIWAEKNSSGFIHIHMTGDNKNFKHITVCNNPNSKKRYNEVLFRDLRKLLIAYKKWPYKGKT